MRNTILLFFISVGFAVAQPSNSYLIRKGNGINVTMNPQSAVSRGVDCSGMEGFDYNYFYPSSANFTSPNGPTWDGPMIILNSAPIGNYTIEYGVQSNFYENDPYDNSCAHVSFDEPIKVVTVTVENYAWSSAPPSSVCGNGPINFGSFISTTGGVSWSVVSGGGSFTGATWINPSDYYGDVTIRARKNYSNGGDQDLTHTFNVRELISISAQPQNSTTCPSGSTQFSVSAAGHGASYQWQESVNGGGAWNNLINAAVYSGVTTTTLHISNVAGRDGYLYRAVVNGTCNSVNSNNATFSLYGQVSITGSPANSTICSGSNTTFSASGTAQSGSLSYQWQVSTDGGSVFADLSNGGVYSDVTTGTLTLTGATSPTMNNYKYRCKLIDACGAVNSNITASGTLTFYSEASVSSHPSNVSTCVTGDASFSVSGNGSGTLTYQWQESSDGGTIYNNISNVGIYSGATTATLTVTGVPSASYSGYKYRCRITNLCTTATSNPGTLTATLAPTISGQPVGSTVCAAAGASFSVTATGTSLSYKWQKSSTGNAPWTDVTGATSATYSIGSTILASAGYYQCLVSNTCGSVTSNPVQLQVNPNTAISVQPANTSVCPGVSANFSTLASGTGTVTYIWQFRTSVTGTFANVVTGASYSGATTNALTVIDASGKSGYQFRVIVHSNCGTDVTSNNATLTLNTIPTAPTVSDVSRCGDGTISATATTGASSPSWKWYNNGSDTSPVYTGGSTYTITNLTSNQTKYVSVTSSGCESAKSTVNFTRNSLQVINLGTPLTLCAGQGTYNLEGDISAAAVAIGNNFTWTANSINYSGKMFDPSVGVGSYTVSYSPPSAAQVSPHCYTANTRSVSVISSGGDGGIVFSNAVVSGGNTVNTCVGNAPLTISDFPSVLGGTWSTVAGSGISSSGSTTVFTPTSSNYTATTPNTFRYSVTVGGCSASKDLSIYVKDNNNPPIVNGVPSVICPATSITATASVSAAGTYSFEWYRSGMTLPFHTENSLTYNVSNSETLEVRSLNTFGCRSNATFVPINTPFASGVIGLDKSEINVGDNVAFNYNVTTSGNIHEWTFGDGGKSTEKNPIHYYYSPGDYVVSLVITSTLGCSQTLTYSAVKVNGEPFEVITGVDDPRTALKEVKTYPMPFESVLSLDAEFNIGTTSLQLVSMTGGVTLSKEIDIQYGENEIISHAEGSSIPPGIYILKLQNKSLVQTIKVIKK